MFSPVYLRSELKKTVICGQFPNWVAHHRISNRVI